MSTTTESPMRNGVDTATLFATLDAVKANPEIAKFQFRATNTWISGTHNRSTIHGFYAAGGEDTTRSEAFEVDAGEPAILLGTDQGPNPAEYLLHARAACVATSLVFFSAPRGVRLAAVRDHHARRLFAVAEEIAGYREDLPELRALLLAESAALRRDPDGAGPLRLRRARGRTDGGGGVTDGIGDRDRLLLAFAELSSWGIVAEDSLPGTADRAREDLLVRRWGRAPQAMGSYVFWLAADDTCFGPDGRLRAVLPLHASSDVFEPLLVVLAGAGLTTVTREDSLAVTHAA